nr:MAG TPA: hypothetical protein [Caudoviricetes sp.]
MVAALRQPPSTHRTIGLKEVPLVLHLLPADAHLAVLAKVEPALTILDPASLHHAKLRVVRGMQVIPGTVLDHPAGLEPTLLIRKEPLAVDLEPARLPRAIILAIPPAVTFLHPARAFRLIQVIVPVLRARHVSVGQLITQRCRTSSTEKVRMGEHIHTPLRTAQPIGRTNSSRQMRARLNRLIRNSPTSRRATNVRMLNTNSATIHAPITRMISRIRIMHILAHATVRIHIVMRRRPIRNKRTIHALVTHTHTRIMMQHHAIQRATPAPLREIRRPNIVIRIQVNVIHNNPLKSVNNLPQRRSLIRRKLRRRIMLLQTTPHTPHMLTLIPLRHVHASSPRLMLANKHLAIRPALHPAAPEILRPLRKRRQPLGRHILPHNAINQNTLTRTNRRRQIQLRHILRRLILHRHGEILRRLRRRLTRRLQRVTASKLNHHILIQRHQLAFRQALQRRLLNNSHTHAPHSHANRKRNRHKTVIRTLASKPRRTPARTATVNTPLNLRGHISVNDPKIEQRVRLLIRTTSIKSRPHATRRLHPQIQVHVARHIRPTRHKRQHQATIRAHRKISRKILVILTRAHINPSSSGTILLIIQLSLIQRLQHPRPIPSLRPVRLIQLTQNIQISRIRNSRRNPMLSHVINSALSVSSRRRNLNHASTIKRLRQTRQQRLIVLGQLDALQTILSHINPPQTAPSQGAHKLHLKTHITHNRPVAI